MALTPEQIVQLSLEWPAETNDWASHIDFARAIEAEVRKQDDALILQLVEALEGYRRNHNDTQPCDAEREGRAWLEGKP